LIDLNGEQVLTPLYSLLTNGGKQMPKNRTFSIHPEDPILDTEIVKSFLEHSDDCDLLVQKRPGGTDLNLMFIPKPMVRRLLELGAAYEDYSGSICPPPSPAD
jgi:hypothetical protein